jgi:hypothetical protein
MKLSDTHDSHSVVKKLLEPSQDKSNRGKE